MKTYEDLKQLMFDNDKPIDYLKESIDRGLEAKSDWLKCLKLNEGNNFRGIIPLPQTFDSLPYANNFILSIKNYIEALNDVSYIDFTYCILKKNKLKISKIISQNFEAITCLSAYHRLCNDINNKRLDQGYHAYDFSNGNDNLLQTFLISYGDYVKNGLVSVVSANPWDYLVLSDYEGEYCSYSSCVRYNHDGEYFNSCLHYLASPSVFVGYTADKDNLDKKIGRCMIYIGGNTTVSTGRVYGNMSDGAVIAIRDYCQQSLSDDGQILLDGIAPPPSRWVVKGTISDCKSVANNTSAYVDEGYGMVTVLKDKEIEKCCIENGMCLECGNEIDSNPDGGTCNDCKESNLKCCSCGNRVYEDDARYYDDECYCESCFNEQYDYCEKCGNDIPVDDMSEVHDGKHSRYVCNNCRDRNYTYCNECNKYYPNDKVSKVGDDYICQKCFEDNYSTCDICEEYTKEVTLVDGKHICNDCLESNYIKCSVCEEYYLKEDTENGVCCDCVKSLEPEVEKCEQLQSA